MASEKVPQVYDLLRKNISFQWRIITYTMWQITDQVMVDLSEQNLRLTILVVL